MEPQERFDKLNGDFEEITSSLKRFVEDMDRKISEFLSESRERWAKEKQIYRQIRSDLKAIKGYVANIPFYVFLATVSIVFTNFVCLSILISKLTK